VHEFANALVFIRVFIDPLPISFDRLLDVM
jgi:hypothetical protein